MSTKKERKLNEALKEKRDRKLAAAANRPSEQELQADLSGIKITASGCAWINTQMVILYAGLPDRSRQEMLKDMLKLSNEGDGLVRLMAVGLGNTLVRSGLRMDDILGKFMKDNPEFFSIEDFAGDTDES